MSQLPGNGPIAGTLAFMFVNRLCERLERNGTLPSGEAARIWADIAGELKNDGRQLAIITRQFLTDELGLAKK